MVRSRNWLILGVAALLAACATPEPMITQAPSGDPFAWSFEQGADRAWLRYGAPGRDAAGLILSCPRQATTIAFSTLMMDAGAKPPTQLVLGSGPAVGHYPVTATWSDGDPRGYVARGAIALTEPVLAAFEDTGQLSQLEARAYAQNAEVTDERIAIRQFFRFCRG